MKNYTSLQSIQADLYAGDITCRQLVEFYLQNITEKNTQLNAFLKVFDQEALAKADEIDQKIKAGTAGKLAGMVIGIKDNICYKNHQVSASSKMLDGFISPYSSTVVERLISEDAIIIGRHGLLYRCDITRRQNPIIIAIFPSI